LSLDTLGQDSAMHQEAIEVAWLLGAPFLVLVLFGPGEQITQIIAGLVGTSVEGQRQIDAEWRMRTDRLADLVIAIAPGEAGGQDFSVVSRALGNAARAVKSKGKIVLITRLRPDWPLSERVLLQAFGPGRALQEYRDNLAGGGLSTFTWLSTAQRASVYLLSGLAEENSSRYFVTTLHDMDEVKPLIAPDTSCLVLPFADRTLVDISD
jgi:hypothetical protein